MKTIKSINDSSILKRAVKTWGTDCAVQCVNEQAKRWITALKKGTIYAVIVRQNSQSDTIKLFEVNPKNRYYYNFNALLYILGYHVSKSNNIVAYGGNMDVLHDTNRKILKRLENIGVISGEERTKLEFIQIPKIYL